MDKQKPNAKPETLNVTPLTALPRRDKQAGRPRNLIMPDLPKLEFSELEQAWFDYILDSYQKEYPDLTDTDKMYLPLIAIEYIKYLRTAKQEIESGQLVMMSRTHPMTNLKSLVDQLSVTRKARKQDKTAEPDSLAEMRSKLREVLG